MTELAPSKLLYQPVTALKGVNEATAEKLLRLGISRVVDLLFHLPMRYQDRTRIYQIGSLRAEQEVTVEGEIELTEVVTRARKMLLCHISDGTGLLTLRFFHFTNGQKHSLSKGAYIRCFGEVRQAGNKLEMVHPEYRLVTAGELPPLENTLTPTYPSTEGMQQRSLSRLIKLALEYAHELEELLPPAIVREYSFPPLVDCIRLLHQPPSELASRQLLEGRHPVQQR